MAIIGEIVDPIDWNSHEPVQVFDAFSRGIRSQILVRPDRLDDLIADRVNRIQSIHGALKDDRNLLPTYGVQLGMILPETSVRATNDIDEISLLRGGAEPILCFSKPVTDRGIVRGLEAGR